MKDSPGERGQEVIIRHTHEGIFVEHNFDELAELAQSALTLVRSVAQALGQANPAAQQYFARCIAEAAQEGGVTPVPLEPQ